jgi:general stress protein 26
MKKTALKSSIQEAGASNTQIQPDLAVKEANAAGLALLKKSQVCVLGTMGEDGFINIRSMLNLKNKGLKQIWFSTNTSSKKVSQIKKDDRACVYYLDEKNFEGLMLNGTIEILQDAKSRKMLWSEGSEVYYPLGVDDPDYTVLRFTAQKAKYYHGLKNIQFEII